MKARDYFTSIVLLSALLFAVVQAGALPPLNSLDGVYRIRGSEGEKTYAGTATIEERGDVFHVVFATGPHAVVGTGIREGGYLAVSWRDKIAGLTLYKIDGRKLEGRWIAIGMEGTGNETLTWVSPLEPEEQPRDERKMKGAE